MQNHLEIIAKVRFLWAVRLLFYQSKLCVECFVYVHQCKTFLFLIEKNSNFFSNIYGVERKKKIKKYAIKLFTKLHFRIFVFCPWRGYVVRCRWNVIPIFFVFSDSYEGCLTGGTLLYLTTHQKHLKLHNIFNHHNLIRRVVLL